MIGKTQIRKIVFIKNNISNRRVFEEDLLDKIENLFCQKISQPDFNRWLDSWIATTELDLDRKAASCINKAIREIRNKKTPYKSWGDFKSSMGL
jgi:hypothetical protein